MCLLLGCGPSANLLTDQVAPAASQHGYKNLEFVAGSLGGRGNADGIIGRFDHPTGIAVSPNGNVYVSDGNYLRVISPDGIVTTLVGSENPYNFGYDREPQNDYGLAIDSKGNLYLVDPFRCQIKQIKPSGEVSIFAGVASCGYADGDRTKAQFGRLSSIVVDHFDVIYVADTSNYVIRKIDTAGMVSTFVGQAGENGVLDGLDRSTRFFSTIEENMLGKVDGLGKAARFLWPKNLAINSNGTLYVSDGYKVLRMISPSGEVSTFSGRNQDGSPFHFSGLAAMVADNLGNLFVADGASIKKIDASGIVSTYVGRSGKWNVEGNADQITFDNLIHGFPNDRVVLWMPGMMAVDAQNNLYYANTLSKVISKIKPNREINSIAGKPENETKHFAIDGLGAAASFTCRICWNFEYAETEYRVSMTTDTTGTIFVNDQNYKFRKVLPSGDVSSIEGALQSSYGGVITQSGLRAWFEKGRFYRLDEKKEGHSPVFVAGDGSNFEYSSSAPVDGFAEKAIFFNPIALTLDPDGNAYVIERRQVNFYDTDETIGGAIIRRITPTGLVTSIAGNFVQHGSLDGPGLQSRFNVPSGLAADREGNLYIADTYNHTIRKLDKAGNVTTYAGTPTVQGSQDGDRRKASFNRPCHLVFDSFGNLYVADNGNYLIRKISPTGEVSTVAGKVGVRGVIPGPLPTSISLVMGLTVDANDNLYLFSEYSVVKLSK